MIVKVSCFLWSEFCSHSCQASSAISTTTAWTKDPFELLVTWPSDVGVRMHAISLSGTKANCS